jgi:hypothetical protein
MVNVGIAFYVVGALFTLYVVAATWRSRDADPRVPAGRRQWKPRTRTMDRRIAHWWRARQR